MGSTITTAVNSTVTIINGGSLCNVYWQVGSSATIQTGNVFLGNILALTSITLDGGTLEGRALARNGAVTIASQETVDNSDCTCSVFATSSSKGAVSKLVAPAPKQSVIATGLTSAEGLACGKNQLLYVAQSGVSGGPLRIVTISQSGKNLKDYIDFGKTPALASSGGPVGPSLQPSTGTLFFSTTASMGSQTAACGAWAKHHRYRSCCLLPRMDRQTEVGQPAS